MLRIYTSKNMQKEMDMLSCLFNDNISPLEVEEPIEPEIKKGDTTITKAQNSIYNARINMYIKEERSLRSAVVSLYNIMWGHCSPMMQNRLESLIKYHKIRKDSNTPDLLKEIRGFSNELEVSANVYDTLDEAKRKYYTYS